MTATPTILAQRLRYLADEIDSAARYGLPTPRLVSVSGHPEYGGATISATPEEFDAWAEYTEAEVETYEHNGSDWRRAEADVNGLRLEFSHRVTAPAEVTA